MAILYIFATIKNPHDFSLPLNNHKQNQQQLTICLKLMYIEVKLMDVFIT